MISSAPIGIFDSGIGGLSVWQQIVREIPAKPVVYVADSRFAPYGTKSRSFITDRSRVITRFLLEQGCGAIVVACNTATGAAISTLRKEFDVPFIGVEPAVKPAALESKTGHVGVLATAQTFKGEHFKRSIRLYGGAVQVHTQVGTGLVELIESGRVDAPETRQLLEKYLLPMVDQGIDQLVLGCTHYPFLIPVIREILPNGIQVIDPAPAVARQTRKVLELNRGAGHMTGAQEYRFFTTGDPEKLSGVLEVLTGKSMEVVSDPELGNHAPGISSSYQPA